MSFNVKDISDISEIENLRNTKISPSNDIDDENDNPQLEGFAELASFIDEHEEVNYTVYFYKKENRNMVACGQPYKNIIPDMGEILDEYGYGSYKIVIKALSGDPNGKPFFKTYHKNYKAPNSVLIKEEEKKSKNVVNNQLENLTDSFKQLALIKKLMDNGGNDNSLIASMMQQSQQMMQMMMQQNQQMMMLQMESMKTTSNVNSENTKHIMSVMQNNTQQQMQLMQTIMQGKENGNNNLETMRDLLEMGASLGGGKSNDESRVDKIFDIVGKVAPVLLGSLSALTRPKTVEARPIEPALTKPQHNDFPSLLASSSGGAY